MSSGAFTRRPLTPQPTHEDPTMQQHPDGPLAPDAFTQGVQNLIGDLLAPPPPDSPEQKARARIRGLARSIVGAMMVDNHEMAATQAQAVVDFPQYGAAPGIAAEHMADFVRSLAARPLLHKDNPEQAAAAKCGAAVLAGGPGAVAAIEQMRQDDALARNTLLVLAAHVHGLLEHVDRWAHAADLDFSDADEGTDTSLERRDV